MIKRRLHLLALPHTITRDEFSHCAFTGKVQRFAPMMRSLGYEVYHYGVETSDANATKQIDILSLAEWNALRVESYVFLHPEFTVAQATKILEEEATFIGDLGNVNTPLYKEFNRRVKEALQQHYVSTATDIVCLPFGCGHAEAIKDTSYVCVETGIGYMKSFLKYRIFESYAILHQTMQADEKSVMNYWFVAPNYYDTTEFTISSPRPLPPLSPRPTVGFLGRICKVKGCDIIVEIAKCFPDVDFILCGQGEPNAFLTFPNIIYKPPIAGKERCVYLNSLICLLAPSNYCEPFCGVNVEAQLCGIPVLGPSAGAFVETIEPFKTGLLCHTLQDYCEGVRMALAGQFADPVYIRARAVRLYNMYNVAHKYDYIFKTILDVHNGKNGWYSPDTHININSQ